MIDSNRVFEGGFVLVDRMNSDRQRATEIVRTKAGRFSVAFLIYDPATDAVILVRQDRSPMVCDINPKGTILEAPAGRCDKQESVKAVIAREASEEVGASIDEDQIKLLNGGEPLALSPGILDELMYLAYVILRPGQLEPDRVFGLPEEGEKITRLSIPAAQAETLACEDMKTLALLLEFRNRRLQERVSTDEKS